MIKKNILKKIPIIKRIYPSLIKRIFKLVSKSEIKFNFFDLNLIGDINEPMDKEIYLFNEYENKQIEYLIKNITESNFEYFIDVGANSGVYSLIINNKFNYIKIRSFEPVKKSIKKFIINLKKNPKLKNIKNKYNKIITIEEGVINGGFGDGVASWLLEQEFSGKLKRLGLPDNFVEHGPRDTILKNLGLDSNGIKLTILEMLNV